jgi:hypothetical protein
MDVPGSLFAPVGSTLASPSPDRRLRSAY